MAFFCIDETFRDLPHKPDKKSLKHDENGKYLELGFISPILGLQYADTLQSLADQTGWRIRIADKINQNELFKTAQLLCLQQDITLAKNPSYLPAQQTVQLKLSMPQAEEKLRQIAKQFLEQTGCSCIFLS